MKKALMVANAASMIHLFNEDNIKLLVDNGYEVHIACNFVNGNTVSADVIEASRKRWESEGIICHQIDFLRTPFSFKQITIFRKLLSLIKLHRFDIIHCHTPIASVLTRLAAIGNRRKYGTKVIYTAHGFHFYKGASILNWLIYFTSEWISSFFTDILLTINEEDFARAKKFMRTKTVEYIPGVGVDVYNIDEKNTDINKIKESFGISSEETVLMSIGELNKNKNHEVIIRALSQIDLPYKYIICGIGNRKEYLESLTNKLGISHKVVFAGFRKDIKELLTSVDIFCFPSYREGLSVSLMEAMASKLPVVASMIRGNIDLITENKGGFLYRPNDVDGFRRGIEFLMENPETMKKFGEYNHEKIKGFTREILKTKMKEFYFGIVSAEKNSRENEYVETK